MMDYTPHDAPHRFGFLLVPNFSMAAFTNAIEPLRIANRLSGRALYEWEILSVDGGPITCSNGVTVQTDVAMSEAGRLAGVIVWPGIPTRGDC